MKHLLTLALILSSFGLACAKRSNVAAGPGALKPYTGPTLTMAEVVQEINANNAALPTLWARHYFEANLVDPDRRRQFVNGEGVLLYKQPQGMRLVGQKPGVGTVFEIGSDEERYWLSMTPPNDPSRMWWGWYRHLGKPCVDAGTMPIRPDLVLQVLGIATINTNFLAPPVPTMRFNSDPNADAYVFVWNVPLGDRWAAQKEIWYDRQTKRPRLVVLFDEHGRVVLRARLLNHQPVELDGVPRERWPEVARRYELFFPDTGSTMMFDLDEVAPERRGVPTRRGIAFPEDPKVDEVIQLDEACAD